MRTDTLSTVTAQPATEYPPIQPSRAGVVPSQASPEPALVRRTVLVVLLAVVTTSVAACDRSARTTDLVSNPTPAADSIRDQDIAFYEQRLREDTLSAADRTTLAQLYLSRSRERGTYEDIERAEALARESLGLREAHNAGTYQLLASALLAKHDFEGALDAARRLVAADPTSPSHVALLGEVLLEIGDYDAADSLFRSIEGHTSHLSVAARLARWYEVNGRLHHARNVARYAARRTTDNPGVTPEQASWFHMRAAELALKQRDFAEADSLLTVALGIFPGDYRVRAVQARSFAIRGQWTEAITVAEQVLETQPDPGTLGLLSEAYAARGDTQQARAYQRAATATALEQPGPIHRAWGLFILDHGDRAEDVLARVQREMRTRRDVYGYDLLAWTFYRLGRIDEAWSAMQIALARGTEDPLLWAHAAAIAKARGDKSASTAFVQRLVAVN